MAIQGRQHSKLPVGSVMHVRDTDAPIRTEDAEQTSPEYIAAGLLRIREALSDLARQTENRSNPVDEYNTGTLGVGMPTTTIINLQPTYEYFPEKILAILVAGPPAASVTLTLGDRIIPLVIPAAGILPIGPVGIILGRNDPRQLTAQTPGTYFLELTGWGDRRFNI